MRHRIPIPAAHHRRAPAVGLAGFGLVAALAALPAEASDTTATQTTRAAPAGQPRDDAVRANYDSRDHAAPTSVPTRTAAGQRALARQLGPQGVVDVDPVTGTPRMVAKLDGFLTPPSDRAPAEVALAYVRSHLDAFGLNDRDLDQLRLSKDYVDILGTHHLVWQQRVGGIPAFDNGLRANVTKDGRLVNVLGSPIHGLDPPTLRPALSAEAARVTALHDGGVGR